MDYAAFVAGNKTLLVAPAGYGKTHTIVECLKHAKGVQLILTHTHAGVAAIKEKLKKENIASSCYRIETISSFAQKYVHAFYTGGDIPAQEDSKNYHTFIIKSAIEIFKSKSVRRVLTNTYQGMFVDEYQDCSKEQHSMIMQISDILPTHILGDPLQGIFDFNGEAVSFSDDLSDFELFPELATPYRWYQNGNNSPLGDQIKEYRAHLESGDTISLSGNDEIGLHVKITNDGDFHNPLSDYRKWLKRLIEGDIDSLLIIMPPDQPIKVRAKNRAIIDPSRSIVLMEAIDDEMFYSLAKNADTLLQQISESENPAQFIKEQLLSSLFIKTDLDRWFGRNGLKRKQGLADREKIAQAQALFDSLVSDPSADVLHSTIVGVKKTLSLKYLRDELYFSFIKALQQANLNGSEIYDAMKKNRNVIRRVGRKVQGKCIGTTLLTKGLEFDTVAILDAHKFNCHKHLYVALSRGCKKLIVFSNTPTLSPYPNA